jgi:aminoglycoside phosphotransferase (APT) family kinase protein
VLKGYLEPVIWQKHEVMADCKIYARETEVLQSLSRIKFLMPKVYIYETDPIYLGYPFVIMEKIEELPTYTITPESMANVLTKIHRLDVAALGIKECSLPKDCSEYAVNWGVRFRLLLHSDKNLCRVSKVFELATRWVKDNAPIVKCSRYSLIHGDFHNGNVLFTKNSGVKIIDWEKVEIGDAAFDVAYAYHMFILLGDPRKKIICKTQAKRFVQEYIKRTEGDINKSLEFYKVLTSLAIALTVTSRASSPLIAYRSYGLFNGFKEFFLLHFPVKNSRVSELSFNAKIVRYFEGILVN